MVPRERALAYAEAIEGRRASRRARALRALLDGDGALPYAALSRIARGAPAVAGLNHRLPHFQHLFSGSSYAAGYYVYLWAEVLDADAYDAFVEAGDPFDAEVAQRVRRWIYASGNSVEPGAAYEAFRGRPASIEPMLRERGLN